MRLLAPLKVEVTNEAEAKNQFGNLKISETFHLYCKINVFLAFFKRCYLAQSNFGTLTQPLHQNSVHALFSQLFGSLPKSFILRINNVVEVLLN